MNQATVIHDIARAAPTPAECLEALKKLSEFMNQSEPERSVRHVEVAEKDIPPWYFDIYSTRMVPEGNLPCHKHKPSKP